jgi:hypothetical protein
MTADGMVADLAATAAATDDFPGAAPSERSERTSDGTGGIEMRKVLVNEFMSLDPTTSWKRGSVGSSSVARSTRGKTQPEFSLSCRTMSRSFGRQSFRTRSAIPN